MLDQLDQMDDEEAANNQRLNDDENDDLAAMAGVGGTL